MEIVIHMTLDSDDIKLLREMILDCLGIEPQPSKGHQLMAMIRDPELARQRFKKSKTKLPVSTNQVRQ